MNLEQVNSTEQTGPIATDGGWVLRQPDSEPHIDWRNQTPPPLRYDATGFVFPDLPGRTGARPATLRGPLHIQCNGHGDPQLLSKLTGAVLNWPDVETNLPDDNSSNTIPIRLEESTTGYNFAAFISPREFARVLLGAPTIYLALPLVYAHWTIVRGWGEPHYLCSHGLMPPGTLVVYTPRDQHELSICYSLFLAAYTAASEWSNRAGNID